MKSSKIIKFLLIQLILDLLSFKLVSQNISDLNELLKEKYPYDSTSTEERWIFFGQDKNIEKIEKPYLNQYIPGYAPYKVKLTHFMDYHVVSFICVILFNAEQKQLILIPPLSFNGVTYELLNLFEGIQFDSQKSLLKFLLELQDLLVIDSETKFINEKISSTKITYDLTHPLVQRQKIWNKMEIQIDNNKIISFKIGLNP